MPRFVRQNLSRHFEPYKLVYSPHEEIAVLIASYCAWTREPWHAGERVEKLLKYMCEQEAPNVVTVQVPPSQRHMNYDIVVPHCARLTNSSIELKILCMRRSAVGKYVPLFVPAYVP